MPLLRWRRRARWALAMVLLCASAARTQDVTEPSLKAAIVYNFAKFTEWPLDVLPVTASFTACVVGDGPIGDALARVVKGRKLTGRGINVSRVLPEGPLRSCHLLYVSGLPAAQVIAVLAAVRGAPVLTISDMDDFDRIGGIAHLFVENGRIRFDLNHDVARRSRLELSSQLLALAAHVHEGQAGPR